MSPRWFLYIICIAAAVPLSRALAVQAEHESGGHAVNAAHDAGPAAHAAHEDEGKKPPLLSFAPGSAIWSIIVFLILLALLGKFAWPPILKGLQQREKFITESIDSAR